MRFLPHGQDAPSALPDTGSVIADALQFKLRTSTGSDTRRGSAYVLEEGLRLLYECSATLKVLVGLQNDVDECICRLLFMDVKCVRRPRFSC